MSCLGVHFALTEDEASAIERLKDEADRLAYVQEEIEPKYFAGLKAYFAESDKAWDAMHRALSDGRLTDDGGAYPLNLVVLGGKALYTDDDYIMSLKSPADVKAISVALSQISQDEFRRRYELIDTQDYGFPLSDDDFEYTWEWFQGVRSLYELASKEGRHVLFTADQ